MNKLEVQKRFLQNGKPLDLEKFEWDEKTNTFSSKENYLVIDFNEIDDCTFDTGSGCTFKTGSGCTFKTDYGCTFKTGSGCTFKTGYGCTWIIKGKKYLYPPLHFFGSVYFMEFSKPGFIRSGCIEKPLAWWEENIVRCAEEHQYTPEQIEEYKLYVQMLKLWMVANKVDKEIENDNSRTVNQQA